MLFRSRKLYRIIVNSAELGKKGLYDNKRWTKSAIDIMQALESAGVKMNFYGMDNITSNPNATIFLSNHMSTLETMVPVAIIEPVKPVLFVIKKELAEYPVFKHVILAREPIIVGRQNPKEDLMTVLNEGAKRLKEGKSIILFPQRTRSPIFEVHNFNTLGVKLAKRSNVTVTPMAVLTDAWSNGKLIKEVGTIDIKQFSVPPHNSINFKYTSLFSPLNAPPTITKLPLFWAIDVNPKQKVINKINNFLILYFF